MIEGTLTAPAHQLSSTCMSPMVRLSHAYHPLVKIRYCPKLVSIAGRSLGENMTWKFEIRKSMPESPINLECLHQIYIWDCSSFTSFPKGGLPNTLSRISIGKCENLVALPDRMHNLSSLQELEICQCRRIMSFPRRFSHFPNNTYN